MWTGEFEGRNNTWLRWCDQAGSILLTGDERAQQAEQRAQLLAERLKALAVEPGSI